MSNDKQKYILTQNSKTEFEKECPTYNYIQTIYPEKKRIVVIGDIHGDYSVAIRCLVLANVINYDLDWIASPEDTFVVQVGDQIDRCRPYQYKCDHPLGTSNDEASDIKIMKLFSDLHIKASKKGGAVISLFGNHELMNVMGNMNYVSHAGLEEFKDYVDTKKPDKKFSSGKEARIHAFKPGNELSVYMACSRISTVIIGSNIFVHAGIIPGLVTNLNIKSITDFDKINVLVRKWLLGTINQHSISNIVTSQHISPFWIRVLGQIPPNINFDNDECNQYLKPVLKLFKLNNMIIGHTPQFINNDSGINATCNNKLWRVDNGASNAFAKFDKNALLGNSETSESRKIQILEILNDNEFYIIKE